MGNNSMLVKGAPDNDMNVCLPFLHLSATTAWNFLVGGTIKTFGMQYVEFMNIFPNTPAEVGMIGLVLGIMGIFVGKFQYIICMFL